MSDLWLYLACTLSGLLLAYNSSRAPVPYRRRTCTGRAWRRAFPAASKKDIRVFLHCFVDGMAVSRKAALQFHPDDQVMDVYHAIYGGYPVFGDNMELERVLAAVGAAFGKRVDDLHRVWHGDITLGELFAFASAIQT